MKYNQLSLREIILIPESRDEAKMLNRVTRKFDPADEPEAYAKALDELTGQTIKVKEGGFYRVKTVSSALDPYMERLREWFLHFQFKKEVDMLPSLDAVQHGRFLTRAAMLPDGTLELEGYVRLYGDSKDETPKAQREVDAECKLLESIAEQVNYRPPIEEFRQLGNGHYARNPDYATGKRNPIRKCIPPYGGDEVWTLLLKAFIETVATDKQLKLLGRVLYSGKHEDAVIRLRDFTVYIKDEKGTINYDGKGTMASCYKPEQFRGIQA